MYWWSIGTSEETRFGDRTDEIKSLTVSAAVAESAAVNTAKDDESCSVYTNNNAYLYYIDSPFHGGAHVRVSYLYT